VASGDFNSDGHTDIALGAPLANGPNDDREGAGEVHVFFGPIGPCEQRDAADGGSGLAFFGATEGDAFGRRLGRLTSTATAQPTSPSALPTGDNAGAPTCLAAPASPTHH
jgi:hypothetical protein